ncbi:hypothetical protein PITCH_A480002 [uncultured Desulfobacterium sp.]|uniref:Uncharacterized protein n=1 Tax=uncultured Desulfobacterium sp. TaxID=201089 RepID=A0A445N0E0_9BACT|nr:hypothetical protein PITCH_A480002 [uncultured Desulfobacterium sp.]
MCSPLPPFREGNFRGAFIRKNTVENLGISYLPANYQPLDLRGKRSMKKYTYLQSAILKFMVSGMFFIFVIITPCLATCEPSLEQNIKWCKAIALEASEKAFQAQATCDYPSANEALKLADEAAYLAAKMCRQAKNTPDPVLSRAVYDVCSCVEAAINNVIRTANHIGHYSTNQDEIQAANFLLEDCESIKKNNRCSIETTLACLDRK